MIMIDHILEELVITLKVCVEFRAARVSKQPTISLATWGGDREPLC